MRRCFLIIQTLKQRAVFPNFARQIALIQCSGRSKHAVPLHNKLENNHIIKSFHEENFIMSGLFSQKNLLLCGVLGNNGLLAKRSKNFQNHLYGQLVLSFDKDQTFSASCCKIKHWFACVEDGRSRGRCAVKWLPNFFRWADFLSCGATLACAWSSAMNTFINDLVLFANEGTAYSLIMSHHARFCDKRFSSLWCKESLCNCTVVN